MLESPFRRFVAQFLLLSLTGASTAGFAEIPSRSPSAAVAASKVDPVAAGKRVYAAQRCLRCHAVAGEGNSRYPLDGVGSRLDAAQLRGWVTGATADAAKLSPRAMAAKRRFAALPADDLNGLVAYLQTLK